jgi:UV DNA damage endonuclease
MHPDQFVVLNSPDKKIVQNSIRELKYHCKLLDTMRLDKTAKVQIHIGGVYGNKSQAIDRFIKTYNNDKRLMDHSIKKRLVIENDDHLYNLNDCLYINQQTGIPIVFDTFHHECFGSDNNKEKATIAGKMSLRDPLLKARSTWKDNKDGLPIVDYSSQDTRGNSSSKAAILARKGKHTITIDHMPFKNFIKQTECLDFDIMLEIKDKEKSALKALDLLRK